MTEFEQRLLESCLARMREPMVERHPEKLMDSVSDVLECALNLEDFQKELMAENERLKSDASIKEEVILESEPEYQEWIQERFEELKVLRGEK